MLQVKSVVILKVNPHILKRGGGIKMRLWLNVERESYIFRIWKESQNEEDWNKYCEAKKDAVKVVYMAIDQRAWEAVEKVDLCHDCQAKDWGEDRYCYLVVLIKMKVEQ